MRKWINWPSCLPTELAATSLGKHSQTIRIIYSLPAGPNAESATNWSINSGNAETEHQDSSPRYLIIDSLWCFMNCIWIVTPYSLLVPAKHRVDGGWQHYSTLSIYTK